MEQIINIIGVIGALCLAICAAPQAFASYKNKTSNGVDGLFLFLWTLGEILTFFYVLKTNADLILLFNYTFNIICLFVIIRYKVKPSKI